MLEKGFYRHMMYDPEKGISHGVVEVLGVGHNPSNDTLVVARLIHPGILRVGDFELIPIEEFRPNYTRVEDRKLLKEFRKLSAKLQAA